MIKLLEAVAVAAEPYPLNDKNPIPPILKGKSVYLAVKLYQSIEGAPEGIPDSWPAEVKELGESQTLPDESWTLMTTEQYNSHLSEHRAEYNVYEAAIADDGRSEIQDVQNESAKIDSNLDRYQLNTINGASWAAALPSRMNDVALAGQAYINALNALAADLSDLAE